MPNVAGNGLDHRWGSADFGSFLVSNSSSFTPAGAEARQEHPGHTWKAGSSRLEREMTPIRKLPGPWRALPDVDGSLLGPAERERNTNR
jgi:hypothetical protein